MAEILGLAGKCKTFRDGEEKIILKFEWEEL